MTVNGFEDIAHRVDVPLVGPLFIFLNRETRLLPDDNARYGGAHVVGIREMTIPKQAIREYEKALDKLADRDRASAIAHLERAIRIAPDFFEAHASLATEYTNAGRIDKAEDHWTRAAEIRYHDATPLIELGRLYAQLDDSDSALEVLERAVGRDPRNPAAVYYLANALYENSDYDRAEVILGDLLWRYPGHGPLQLVLANVYIQQHRLLEAVDQIDAYLEQHPECADRDSAIEIRGRLMDYLLTLQ